MAKKDTKTIQDRGGKFAVPIIIALIICMAFIGYIAAKLELWQLLYM